MKNINGIINILQLPGIQNLEILKSKKLEKKYYDIIYKILAPENIEEAMSYLYAFTTKIEGLREAMREKVYKAEPCHPQMPETIQTAFTELNRWMSFYKVYLQYMRKEIISKTEQKDLGVITPEEARRLFDSFASDFSSVPTAAFALYVKVLDKGDINFSGQVPDLAALYYISMNNAVNEIYGKSAEYPLKAYFDQINYRACVKDEQALPVNDLLNIYDARCDILDQCRKESWTGTQKQNALDRYDYNEKEIEKYYADKNQSVDIYLFLENEIFGLELEFLTLQSMDKCCSIYGVWSTGKKHINFMEDSKLRDEYMENTMRALHTNRLYGRTRLGIPYNFIRKIFTSKEYQEKTRTDKDINWRE